jgi:bacillopeptidase F (M6 metalloprotease family)
VKDIRQHAVANADGTYTTHRVTVSNSPRALKAVVFDHWVEELSTHVAAHVHPSQAYEFWLKTGQPSVTGVVYEGFSVVSFAQWRINASGVWCVIVGTSHTLALQAHEAPYLQHAEIEALKAESTWAATHPAFEGLRRDQSEGGL